MTNHQKCLILDFQALFVSIIFQKFSHIILYNETFLVIRNIVGFLM